MGGFAELKVEQGQLEKAIQDQGNVAPGQASELSQSKWNSIQFNASGNQLLVGTDQGMSIVLDGFEATVQRVFCPSRKVDRPAVSCFTPDDKSVLSGNDDGTITCYNIESGSVVKRLEGHNSAVGCIAANPKYAQFASCCTNTAVWTW